MLQVYFETFPRSSILWSGNFTIIVWRAVISTYLNRISVIRSRESTSMVRRQQGLQLALTSFKVYFQIHFCFSYINDLRVPNLVKSIQHYIIFFTDHYFFQIKRQQFAYAFFIAYVNNAILKVVDWFQLKIYFLMRKSNCVKFTYPNVRQPVNTKLQLLIMHRRLQVYVFVCIMNHSEC